MQGMEARIRSSRASLVLWGVWDWATWNKNKNKICKHKRTFTLTRTKTRILRVSTNNNGSRSNMLKRSLTQSLMFTLWKVLQGGVWRCYTVMEPYPVCLRLHVQPLGLRRKTKTKQNRVIAICQLTRLSWAVSQSSSTGIILVGVGRDILEGRGREITACLGAFLPDHLLGAANLKMISFP